MTIEMQRARSLLQAFDLRTLFVEQLGWDRPGSDLEIAFEGQTLHLQAVAEKRGLGVYLCPPLADGMPDHQTRRQIEAVVRKSVHEHLLAFTDAGRTRLKFLYVRREPGRPMASRELDWYAGQSGEALLQQLRNIAFALEEEESIGIVDVTSRVRAAFDVERVTKKFYDRFRVERDALRKMVQGIPDDDMADWYVAVTLNRLMFIYFIQKKGFLNGDPGYLATKLADWRMRGKDRYYREFLCPLFFRGFALPKDERTSEDRRLLGDVPYLNGGIFSQHELEQRYGQAIQIPDAAFERIYAFFDAYRWHLDERPLRADNEINPDVLGYIFEKYVNQKQMGAYYTKEDITGYISRNTVLPHLLDRAREGCKVAFTPDGPVWRLLSAEPDRYIWPAVRHGCELPLPPEIQAGVNPPTLHDVVGEGPVATLAARKAWNTPAPGDYGLPTEIWRETVARRQRYEELWEKMVAGELHEVNDLITWNLDIAQFVQDVVENCEGPELLRAFWKALTEVTVLDPTCGSGAFLFAALNLLEPLYEACLERMAAFLEEWERAGVRHPNHTEAFRQVLAEVERHPNRRYYVLKSIIVRNLYGVDIMDEAVEICRLRLFLKLVAQVEDAASIEPLPDIDFNIRAGNTLVGFTSLKEVEEALAVEQKGTTPAGAVKQQVMMGVRPEENRALAEVKEQAEIAGRAYALFQDSQVVDGKVTPEAKADLLERLDALDARLDAALAHTYGVSPDDPAAYARWRASHKPFHWLTAFYGIMNQGGFDVIIGNPPYVQYPSVNVQYSPRGYETLGDRNLYNLVLEQSVLLSHQRSRLSMIVPASLIGTPGLSATRGLLHRNGLCWYSSYNIHPSCLFEGANPRLCIATIVIGDLAGVYATHYHKWLAQERSTLFALTRYYSIPTEMITAIGSRSLPKIGSGASLTVLHKVLRERRSVASQLCLPSATGAAPIYYRRAFGAFLLFYLRVPGMLDELGQSMMPTELKAVYTLSRFTNPLFALYSSGTFYVVTYLLSDCRNVNRPEVEDFPFDLKASDAPLVTQLDGLGRRLWSDEVSRSNWLDYNYSSGRRRFEAFYPRDSKPIIDQIDTVLARHYGFTEEELDFIINYDIKYRMGDALGAGEDEG